MKKLSLICTIFLCFTACAKHKEFSFHGKPIDPWCINSLHEPTAVSVDINNCSDPKHNIDIQTNKNEDLEKKGFIGYAYKYKSGMHVMSQPYIYYKYLGKVGNLDAIYKLWCDGRSGKNAHLYLLKNVGHKLKLVNSFGGDRCMGSVVDAKVVDGKLLYTTDLDPLTFILNAKQDVYNYNISHELLDCAVCCYMKGDFENGKLISVTLNKSINTKAMPETNKMQKCFNNIFNSYLANNKLELKEHDIKAFVNEFMGKCV